VQALVIDEVSMLDAEFFDWYYSIIQQIRGRIQLILCGDFFQ